MILQIEKELEGFTGGSSDDMASNNRAHDETIYKVSIHSFDVQTREFDSMLGCHSRVILVSTNIMTESEQSFAIHLDCWQIAQNS